jgi:2-hydroxy-3-keto-5-methylthiopentenyl-1-phosphate phosphatase
MCKHDKIPLTIVSGGISDIIATMLSTVIDIHDYDQLKIMGNELVFKDDILQGIDGKLCFCAKNLTILNNETIGNRKNIVVLGDVLSDNLMAKNLKYKYMITVLFLNYDPKDSEPKHMFELGQYQEKSDMVITNDGSFKKINWMMWKLIDQEYKDF